MLAEHFEIVRLNLRTKTAARSLAMRYLPYLRLVLRLCEVDDFQQAQKLMFQLFVERTVKKQHSDNGSSRSTRSVLIQTSLRRL